MHLQHCGPHTIALHAHRLSSVNVGTTNRMLELHFMVSPMQINLQQLTHSKLGWSSPWDLVLPWHSHLDHWQTYMLQAGGVAMYAAA